MLQRSSKFVSKTSLRHASFAQREVRNTGKQDSWETSCSSAKQQINQIPEPEKDIAGWRTTQASKDFPETPLRAILQEYELRIRDNLFNFQKDTYKNVIINEFLREHYRFCVGHVPKETKMAGVIARKHTVGQAPWWYWVMILNTAKRKQRLKWEAWKKVRQMLGVSKVIDKSWMIRKRVRRRLPLTPMVYHELGDKKKPRIHINYKVLPKDAEPEDIYNPHLTDAAKDVNRNLWWSLENPYQFSARVTTHSKRANNGRPTWGHNGTHLGALKRK